MSRKRILVVTILVSAFGFAACNDTTSNMNSNASANANTGTITTRTEPTATPTPRYTEEQARAERERAKANKETIGQSLDDAWIHTKIVAKLISDTQTPERKINVDVVDGAVTLRGDVDTAEAKAEAERVAKETDGVKKVTNQLKVVPARAANTNKASTTNTNKPPAKGKTP
ncbi:MAG TPA: BON domain-containing protein [Pyrinomonadaceae bacterium]|jgi:osmotically-inducible protein OsmY|nr:BON domain-containing protein [Pyrinomonadaceae bacterium]